MAARVLAELTRRSVPAKVLAAYQQNSLSFGPDYIIPKPLAPRLRDHVAGAVAHAAVNSGIARLPLPT